MKSIFTIRRSFYALASLFLFGISSTIHAQGTFTFAAPTDGAGTATAEVGRSICSDASGNVYIVGVFNSGGGLTDFDLNSASTSTFSSSASTNDGYIASYDKNGNFRWKTIVTGTLGDFTAPAGGICTNGTFVWVAGDVTMGGSPQIMSSTNTVTITSPGSGTDAFVAKLNCSNGGTVWQQAFGGTGALDFAEGICCDPNGCCYVTGAYSTTFTLGSITAPAPGGTADFFIAKFGVGGNMIRFNSGGAVSNPDMIGNGSGLCYVPGASPSIVATGHTGGSNANFGTFTNIPNQGGNDALLIELDTVLTYTNVLGIGSGNPDELLSAVYDPFSGGVFVCGYGGGNMTFPGTGAITNLGGQDIILGRYSVSGNNFTWSADAGGSLNDRGWAITADGQGGIQMAGFTLSAPCTFSGSVVINTNAGNADIYVVRYTPNGAPQWVLTSASSTTEEARGITSYVQTVPYSQSLFITGIYSGAVTMGSTTLNNDGGNDFFLAKINDANLPLAATQSQVNLTCNGVCTGSATVVASGGTTPYTYSWSPAGGSGATASSLCATNYTVTITDAASTSITKTFNITQPNAIVISTVSQTNVSCFGGSNGAAQVSATGGTGTLNYNWTPNATFGDLTANASGLTAQVYTVTVTDANGCTATRTFNITQPTSPVSGTTVVTNVSCFGGSNGAINLTPTGGSGGYTFNWLPSGPTTEDRTGLIAGTYSVQITDVNGCTGTVTATVTQPTSPVSGTTVVTNVSCFGGSNGAIDLTPTGGSGGYTYNWLPSGPTTQDRTGLVAGTYSVQITDVNGCTGTVTATVTQPTTPVSGTTVVTSVSCFGGSNGTIDLTPTGGSGGYTYNWLPSGPTTQDRTGLTAGTYSVQITDVNGCTGTVTATVTQPTSPVSGTTVVTSVSCFGGSNGTIDLTPTGGSGGYTYNWLPSGPTTQDRTGLTAGTYSVQITDVNGCTGTVTATVTQPTSPVSGTTVVTNVSCFGGSNGVINLTPTGGSGGYTFNWLPSGPTTEDRTGLTAGTYSVQITDVNGCTGTVTATVTQPTSPVSGTTVVTNVSCFGGSNGAIDLTPTGGSGGYTYNWLPSGPTTQDRTGLVAGTYSVQITDVNGCTGTVTATVTQPTTPVSGTTVVTNVSCFGGSNGTIDLTPTGGSGGYTYNWLPSGPTTQDRTGLTAGTYSVQITDVNGCTGTVTATVTQPTSPVSGTTVVTSVSCFGGSNGTIDLTPTGGSGGYTYNWLPSGPTTQDRTGLVAGTYSVQITDVNGCTGTVTATVTQPTSPVSGTTVVTNVSCFGGSNGAINLTPTGGSGGYTFNWLPSGPTTEDRTGLTAGTYSVQITDVNGCTGTVTATVTQPTSPVSGTTVVTNVSCFGGSNGTIDLTPTGGSGGYTYNWLPSGPTTQDRTGLTAGTYSVQITDVNGCTATVTATVTQPTSPVSGTTVVTNVSCFGGSNGAINLTPTGGSGGYTFNWLPSGPTTEDRTGLIAGTYSVQITDVNGCTGTVTATVTQPTSPVSGTTVVTNVSCFGGSNGAIDLTPTGGSGGYTYNWLPSGPTTQDRTGLTAGTYSVQITDVNGCTGTVTATVTQPTSPVSGTTVVTNVSCFGGSNGAINLTPAGGSGGYTFNWLPSGPTTEDRTGLTAGTYSVQITDVNGCTATVTATVTQPTSPVSGTTLVTGVSCFGGSNGAIDLTPTGGSGGYTYNWLPSGPTTQDRTGLTAGTYSVQITDVNGCTGTVTATVTQPTPMVATVASQTNVSCNGGSNGAASVSVTGGTPNYTYDWTPGNPTGDGTPSVSGLTQGVWTCTIRDANLCITTQTFSITQPTAIVSSNTQTNVSCNGGSDGSATVSVTGGTPGYTYNWSPSGGTAATATGLVATSYVCTIMDANLCVLTQSFIITQPTPLVVTSTQTNVLCNGGNNGSATVAISGGTPGYTYTWVPSGGNAATASGLIAGTYTCFITDTHTCSITQSFTITQPPALVATTMQTNVSCNGGSNGSAMVMVSGGTPGYTYLWSPSGGNAASATSLSAGVYTCLITDVNGCTLSQTFNITEPSAIGASATQVDILCNGNATGSATVVASGGVGGYTYLWSPSGGTAPTESGLVAGIYTCTITDANGCTLDQAFNITEPNALSSIDSQTDILCNGGNTGDAMVTVSGGTSGYTYSWSPTGGNLDMATGLTAGNYSCTITDANGCTLTETFLLTESSAIVATTSQTNITCNGGNNGSAAVTVSGGSGSYIYQWAPTGGTASSASGLTAGNYTCTITDALGCVLSQTFLLTEPNALAVTSSQVNVNCNGGTGSATVVVSGGTSPYTYIWTSGGNAATENNLAAGSYTCSIIDANGCSTIATFTITEPAVLFSSDSQVDILCNGGTNGSATVNVSGGVGPYTYNWTSGGNTATETNLPAGSVFCSITDANGCIITETFIIIEPSAFTVTVTATQNPSVCGASDGGINITPSGGTPGYSYLWSNSSLVEDQLAIPAGSYSCTITDAHGCTAIINANLNDPNAPTVTVLFDTTLCVTAGPYTLTEGSPAGGTWSGTAVSGNTFDPVAAGIGSYVLSYTYVDINGCTGSASDTLLVDACLGITNNVSTEWSVYPNPTSGDVTLTSLTSQKGNVLIEVFSTDGKLISSENSNAANTIHVDLSNKPVGTYFIKISGDSNVSTYRVIKL